MTVFAVRYTYDARTDLQAEIRPEHRAYLRGLAEQGAVLGSGPFVGGAPGALLVFSAAHREALDAMLAGDPFAAAGVIAETDVREWAPGVGPWAEGLAG
ncbi:MAG TPA: YciI family protein [Cellulomonas sp.]